MSQHGCPERLSNRSKGFQDDGPSQSTMEVLVETLTGTAFEMTVLPTDTIFAIKSKIFRVEGIPVSQQHLLYNLVELDDASSLHEHSISDGARLRLVLGMRGGPISTRRLPPPPNQEPWRDIERLLDSNRDDVEWGSSGCKVTVLVFRDGERVNMLRVKENHDGTYSPLEHNKYSSTSSSLTQLAERESSGSGEGVVGGTGSLHDNAVTMGKMLELRRRMETMSVQRCVPVRTDDRPDKVEIQKTRSEETLSVPSLLDDSSEGLKTRAASYAPYSDDDAFAPLYDGNYTRYDYDCSFTDRYTLLPPIGTRADSDQSVQDVGADSERIKLSDALAGSILVQGRRDAADEAAILEEVLDTDDCHLRQDSPQLAAKNLAPIQAEYNSVPAPLLCGAGLTRARCGASAAHSVSASSLLRAPPGRRVELCDALFSSSTSDLEKLKRNSRILPALSRHRPREHLHLSDERLDTRLRRRPPPALLEPLAPVGPLASVELPAAPVEPPPAPVESPAAPVEPPAAPVEPPAAPVEPSAAPMEPPAAPVEQSTASVEPPAAPVDQSAALVEPPAASVEPLSAPVELPAASVEQSAASVEPPAASVEPPEVPVEPPAASVEPPEVPVEPPAASVEPPEVPVEPPAASVEPPAASVETPAASVEIPAASVEPPAAPVEPARELRQRCMKCRKRLTIATLHHCRCGDAYCARHRYAEVHGCHYDYRAAATELLARDNPPVHAPKLPRI